MVMRRLCFDAFSLLLMARILESNGLEGTDWSAVVIFEDLAARERARRFSEHWMGQIGVEHRLQTSWWPFAVLEADANDKERAGQEVVEADLIILAARPLGVLPPGVSEWLRTWLERRGEREGVLVDLVEAGQSAGAETAEKHAFVRATAHRCGMDYLTGFPEAVPYAIPDSLDSYADRAEQMTNVLDGILRHPFAPVPTPAPVRSST
jgi:hypothetical protein